MSTSRVVFAPAVVAAALALTGCSLGSSSDTKTVTESVKTVTEQAKTSESASSPSSESSDSTSDSSPSSTESSSDSSSSAGGDAPSRSDLLGYADSHEVRACTIMDYRLVRGAGTASFCTSDKSEITPSYSGQTLYVVTATKYKSGHSYSYTVATGSKSQTSSYDSQLGSANEGQPLSLAVQLPMTGSGTATISFKDNGSTFATKTVTVKAKD